MGREDSKNGQSLGILHEKLLFSQTPPTRCLLSIISCLCFFSFLAPREPNIFVNCAGWSVTMNQKKVFACISSNSLIFTKNCQPR